MRKALLSAIAIVLASANAHAQATYLAENFDVKCVLASDFPITWDQYSPIPGASPLGAWTCAPTEGRGSTPGIKCTGTYSGINHLDTSYLITPLINLNSYQRKVYLRFDTKITDNHSGGRFVVLKIDTGFVSSGGTGPVDTFSAYPVISNGDPSDWVRHEVDLTPLIDSGSFYIAFRYTSTTSAGSTWFLDNVNTDTSSILTVHTFDEKVAGLKVIGNTTSQQVTLSYTTETSGKCDLAIYDMVGRAVHKGSLNAVAGTATYKINDLNLTPGLYVVKINNGTGYTIAKAIVN